MVKYLFSSENKTENRNWALPIDSVRLHPGKSVFIHSQHQLQAASDTLDVLGALCGSKDKVHIHNTHMHNLARKQTQNTTRSEHKEQSSSEKLGNGCMKTSPFFSETSKGIQWNCLQWCSQHFHIHLCTCSQILTSRMSRVTCWIKETIPQCSRENTAALRSGQSEWITEMLEERRDSVINRGRWRRTSAPYA